MDLASWLPRGGLFLCLLELPWSATGNFLCNHDGGVNIIFKKVECFLHLKWWQEAVWPATAATCAGNIAWLPTSGNANRRLSSCSALLGIYHKQMMCALGQHHFSTMKTRLLAFLFQKDSCHEILMTHQPGTNNSAIMYYLLASTRSASCSPVVVISKSSTFFSSEW